MSFRSCRRIAPAASMLVVLCACRPIPIQLVRVAQFETYTQTFELEPEDAKRVFEKLLGPDGWKMLDRRWAELETSLPIMDFVNTIEIKGTLMITLSILPSNIDSFVVEGSGRFYVIHREQENNVILFTGDFFVVDDQHSLAELDDGELVFGIRQQQIRHFARVREHEVPGAGGPPVRMIQEELNYYNDVRVDFRIFVDTSMAKHDVYMMDYSTDRHRVELDGELIGHLKLGEPRPGFRKLIDLRGRRFLRQDYRKKYREGSR